MKDRMKDKPKISGQPRADAAAVSKGAWQALRKQAEEQARAMEPTALSPQTPEEIQRTLHELRVHQIELEMQNEELRAVQLALEESRARYFDLYDLAPVGYCTLAEKGLILEANLSAATLLGTPRSVLVNQPFFRFIFKQDQDIFYLHREKLFEKGAPQECELRLVRTDSTPFWAHLTFAAAQAEDGAPVCRMALSDITERRKVQDLIRLQRDLAFALGAAHDFKGAMDEVLDCLLQIPGIDCGGVYQVDEETGEVHLVSHRSLSDSFPARAKPESPIISEKSSRPETISGCSRIEVSAHYPPESPEARLVHAGKAVYFFDPQQVPDDVDYRKEGLRGVGMIPISSQGKVVACLRLGSHADSEISVESRSLLEAASAQIGPVVARFKAEAALRESQQRLQQTQRLESLGMLAGGIAHDFNNLMMGVFGYIEMAAAATNDGRVKAYLANADASIDRARALTRQLLTFAKGGLPAKAIQPVDGLIRDAVQFALSGSNVACRLELPPDLWHASCDREQIAQVIDNLVINAVQAMPSGGTIDISARNTTIASGQHALLPEGRYLRIDLVDRGIGISAEMLPHIFDPFFTTKAMGHGLGLSTAFSIVKHHDGAFDVKSNLGKGSTFSFYLPAFGKPLTENRDEFEPAPLKATGRILVMDDEPAVRLAMAAMLDSLGFTSVVASSGEEALIIFRESMGRAEPFAALIVDLTVPGGMGGVALLGEIRKIASDVPVFVSSGYADDPVIVRPKELGFVASLCKPFHRNELAQLLQLHLGDPGVEVGFE